MPSPTMASLIEKIHPTRLKCSGKLTAILAYLVNEHGWTDPEITEMVITSDGMVMAGRTNDRLMNDFIGDVADLDRNLAGVAGAVHLDEKEMRLLMRLRATRITRFGGIPNITFVAVEI